MNGYVSCEKNVIKSLQLVNSRCESNAFSSQLSNVEVVLQTFAQYMCIVSLGLHITYKHVIELTFGYLIIMLRLLSKSTFAEKVILLNQSLTRPSIYFSSIVISRSNPTSTKQ